MGDTRGELPERGEFLGLDQPILRGTQLVERERQLVGALLYLLEHANIADGDHGLIGEGLQQGDLFIAERLYFGAAKHDNSDALTLAQQRNAQNRTMALAARHVLCVREFIAFR